MRDNVHDVCSVGIKNFDFTLNLIAPRNGICCVARITPEENSGDESESAYERAPLPEICVMLTPVICVGGQIFSRNMDKVYSSKAKRKQVVVPKSVRELCDQVYHDNRLERITLSPGLCSLELNCCRSRRLKYLAIPQSMTHFFDWDVALQAPVDLELSGELEPSERPTIAQLLTQIFTNALYRAPCTELGFLVVPQEVRAMPAKGLCRWSRIQRVEFYE